MIDFPIIPATARSLFKRKLVHGVGINDADYVINPKVNGRVLVCKYYDKWYSMFLRCYSDKFQESNASYIGCTVHKNWHIFSTFKKWMEKQDWKGMQLDKDIIRPGNKIYSAENCAFVPGNLNKLLNYSISRRGDLPMGAYLRKKDGKYATNLNVNGRRVYLGQYDTPEEASEVYRAAKSCHIKSIAIKQSDPRVRSGLLEHARLITKLKYPKQSK